MTDWTLIAGGRCLGQPWRVGIAGFAFKNQQAFLLSDQDWEYLAVLSPLEPLIAYGKGNGLVFERVISEDAAGLDGVLLFAPGWHGQPLLSLQDGVRKYIALSGKKLLGELADESAFAKLFIPMDLPPYGERLIYVNQHVLRDPACSPEEWAVEKDDHEKDYSRCYSRSADFWIQRTTAAIASDAADQRGDRPLLSVVIPTYNHGRFLGQSVQSALDQGVESIEVIVLDNASTDETFEVMASLLADRRVRYIRNRYNYGPGFNWGNGLQVASGRYIAFLSADDYFNPGHLARLLPIMQTRPDIAVGYSSITWVDGDGQPMSQPRHPGYYPCDYVGGRNEVAELLIQDNYMAPSAVIFDRQALRETWIPVRNGGAGDWDMNIQMAEKFPDFVYVDTPGVSYRWHAAQYSQQHFYASTAPLADHLTIVESVFERNAQHHLKGREPEVAAHIKRRLALYPNESRSHLGVRAQALIERLDALHQSHEAPLFSIILTTYNRPTMLKDALVSIGAQSFRSFEVILVNDHGEPVEAMLAGFDFSVTYLYQGRNGGPAAARNSALKLARGRYVVYLDDDDRYLSGHLQVLAQAIEVWPDEVLYTDAVFITEVLNEGHRLEQAREQRYPHEEYSRERLFVNNYIPINTFACSRALAASNGGFDESLEGLEDWDFLMRLAVRAQFRHVQAETVEVRLRAADLEPDRRSLVAFKDYPKLYRELYSRHSDLGSEAVREGRWELLARFAALELELPQSRALSVSEWLRSRSLTPVSRRLIDERLQTHTPDPSFGIVILDMQGESGQLSLTLESLRQLQGIAERVLPVVVAVTRPPVEVFSGPVISVSVDQWVEPLNEALRSAAFDWFVLVKAGDELTPNGLLVASLDLLVAPECRAVYCDELYRLEGEQLGPAFRPDFTLDYLLSFPAAMAHHWLLRREVVVAAGGFSVIHPEAAEFELILRLINIGGLAGLGHVAEPLVVTDAPMLVSVEDERRAILEHLQGRGYAAAKVLTTSPGRYRLYYEHAEQPLVSCLVLVGSELAQVRRCVESLMETTAYPYYEILLVETAPSSAAVHQWLQALEGLAEARLRVVWQQSQKAPSPSLNHAAMLATGDYLLLLAPEAAVIDGAWLNELLNHAQRPEVGVVGAKLLQADGSVYHAGLILGLGGVAGRPFLNEPMDAGGYMQRLQVDQNYSAVTRACLMIRRTVYEEVGGFDAHITDATNSSVDLCLKVAAAGYLTVWAAHALVMYDGEMVQPGMGQAVEDAESQRFVAEQDAMFSKWLPQIAKDRAYNPNLSLSGAGFSLEPDVQLTWRPLESWHPLPVVLAHPADPWGCGNYRVIQPFQAMQGAGLIDGMTSPGLLCVADLARFDPDVIILQRQIGEERLEAMRRIQAFSSAFKVYELDDYLPNLPLKNLHRANISKDILRTIKRGCSYVDRFVVSTEALANAFAGIHPDIRVLENCLPPSWWRGLSPVRRRGSRPRVGWAGGVGHDGDLELIADVVRELAGEVEWVFFGMCPEKLRPYVAEFHSGVAIEHYPQRLAALDLDLALAPLEQNLFNECKSNLRLLEYGACGFPVVCSDIRCYQGDLPVTRVKNRFKDWVDAVRMHLADLDATARQGDDLRNRVLANWMLDGANLDAWKSAWSER